MSGLRTKRLCLNTEDIDCCPALIGQMTENCLSILQTDLDKEMAALGGVFHSTSAFWTAMLHAMGWTPPERLLKTFPESVQTALLACGLLRRELSRKSPLFPSKALVAFVQQATEDYGKAAKLWGVDVAISLPNKYGPRDITVDALRLTYSSVMFTAPRVCTIGYVHFARPSLASRFEELSGNKIYLETFTPERPLRPWLPEPRPLVTV